MGSIQRQIRAWKLLGWTGSNWAILHEVSGVTDWMSLASNSTPHTYIVNSQTAYDKYAIIVTEINGTDPVFDIQEIEFFAAVPSDPNAITYATAE